MNQSFSEKMRWMTFICSIFIALLHLSVPFANNGQGIIQYYQQLAIPAMSFFFFSSAYFHYRNYCQADYAAKLKRRIATLLIPYIVWNFIDYVVCAIAGYITPSVTGIAKMLIFVYIPVIDVVHEPMLGALWFIIRLLTYEIAAPVFLAIIKKKYIFYPLMVSIIIFNYGCNVNYYAFIYWMPVYLAGAYLAYHKKDKLEKKLGIIENQGTIKDRCLSIALTILAYALYGGYVYFLWKKQIDYTAARYLAIPIILICVYLIRYLPEKIWIVKHGSFFLYCSHVPLRMALTSVLWPMASIFGEIWYPQIYLFSIIIISFVLEWIIYKLCPKMHAVLTGSR